MKKAKIIQIGINGFGKSVSRHVQNCRNIEFLGIHDINTRALMEVAGLFNMNPIKTFDDVLKSDCDGVILEVPNHIHLQLARECARAGKHIFVEKPITNTVEEAEEMIRVCRENNVILQVGHSTRFGEIYRKAKELLDSDAVGRIVLAEANSSSESGKKQTPDTWRFSGKLCPGGPMLQLGIHMIDTVFYLTGSVCREAGGFFKGGYSGTDNDDVGVIVMKLENDILAYVGSSYVSPLTHEMAIYGDKGKLLIGGGQLTLVNSGGTTVTAVEEMPGQAFISEFEGFAQCILDGTQPEVDGEMGLKNLKVIIDVLKTGRAT